MEFLCLITARGGSKGIPGKNIKSLNGKPLLYYSIDAARSVFKDEDICLSTDSAEIINVAEQYGLKVPFVRDESLATDTAASYDVILDALHFYEQKGKKIEFVILLQPTSPFRRREDLEACIKAASNEKDMVVSVKLAEGNPYYNLFEEDQEGFLQKSKPGFKITRRQDAPDVYQYNGSIYVINAKSLKKYKSFSEFAKIEKYVMSDLYSVDIDNTFDWAFCEFLLQKKYIEI